MCDTCGCTKCPNCGKVPAECKCEKEKEGKEEKED
jgi:hypothetical protein